MARPRDIDVADRRVDAGRGAGTRWLAPRPMPDTKRECGVGDLSAEVPEPRRSAPRCQGDQGSTSLSVVLLTPVLVVLMLAAVQAALWGHARTEARVAAKTAAVQVARQGVSRGDARATVAANLADGRLDAVSVTIANAGGAVVVRVTGRAPGIIVGTARSVSVTEAIPIEEVTPR